MTSTNGQAKAIETVLTGSRVLEPADPSPSTVRIVLVHGSMDRQAGFLKLAKVLSRTHVVVSYDRRGYASSSSMGGPFDIEQHVDDLVSVIGDGPALLVGHSFGGTVALACAQRHPNLVSGVVAYENPMPWLPWWPTDTGAGRAARAGNEPERAAEEFLVRFIGRRLWERLPESTKRSRRAEGPALVGELSSIHARPAFDRKLLRVPIVVGVGSGAKEYMRRGADHLAQAPDARLVVLDGAHHNAHSSNVAEFASLLVDPMVDRVLTGRWP